MKIVLYSINYAPEMIGIGKYNTEMAEWLVAQGHQVQVITAPPYYPEWQIKSGYAGWHYAQSWINQVRVWRVPVWVPKKPSGMKRILHLFSFALSSLPVLIAHLFWRPQVIMVIEPPLFCAPMTCFGAWLIGAKSWLHIQDFEVEAAFALGLLPQQPLRQIILNLEAWLMRRFDRVSTISVNMLKKLKAKQCVDQRLVLFPNWVDTQAIYPKKGENNYRQQLGLSKQQVVALYSGNMGEKQGLEIVIQVAKKCQNQANICFIMCGQGAAYQGLITMATGLSNVYWLPLQAIEALNELLNLADIHLLPQRADAADLVMPSKLTGMLASGKAILGCAVADTQVGKVLQQVGYRVDPEDETAFYQALITLANNAKLRQTLGEQARAYAETNLAKPSILGELALKLYEVLD